MCWSHLPNTQSLLYFCTWYFVISILCGIFMLFFIHLPCESFQSYRTLGFMHKSHNLVVVDQENRWKFKIVNCDRGGSISRLGTVKLDLSEVYHSHSSVCMSVFVCFHFLCVAYYLCFRISLCTLFCFECKRGQLKIIGCKKTALQIYLHYVVFVSMFYFTC